MATGLGCLHNKHLLALAVNPSHWMMPSVAAAKDNYLDYAYAVVWAQMLDYFYAAWVAFCLVPANKVHPDDLPPRATLDCCPVNIGSAKRQLIIWFFFNKDLAATFNDIVCPVQNGVRIQAKILTALLL
jgi:hypothetical protein